MKHVIGGMVTLLVALSACSPAPTASTEGGAPPTVAVPTDTPRPLPLPVDPTPVILPTAPPLARVPGVIDFYQESTDDVVQAPEEVVVNTPFDVTIATFGDGCTSVGGATVAVTGNVATITVTDVQQSGVCIQPLLRFPRTVTIQFATPGEGASAWWGSGWGQKRTARRPR